MQNVGFDLPAFGVPEGFGIWIALDLQLCDLPIVVCCNCYKRRYRNWNFKHRKSVRLVFDERYSH